MNNKINRTNSNHKIYTDQKVNQVKVVNRKQFLNNFKFSSMIMNNQTSMFRDNNNNKQHQNNHNFHINIKALQIKYSNSINNLKICKINNIKRNKRQSLVIRQSYNLFNRLNKQF